MKVFQYSKCSTCKKALAFLKTHELHFEVFEITETPPSREELTRMLSFQDGELRKLFNTSGQLYRELGMKDKLAHMSEKDALTLLSQHGMLIKRPFVLFEDMGLLGFNEKKWTEAITLRL